MGAGEDRLHPIYVGGTAIDVLDTRGISEKIIGMSILFFVKSSEVVQVQEVIKFAIIGCPR